MHLFLSPSTKLWFPTKAVGIANHSVVIASNGVAISCDAVVVTHHIGTTHSERLVISDPHFTMYAVGQLVALALLGGLLVPLAAALTLWYAHRRAQPEQRGSASRRRAYLFYRAMAGVLLGQVLCHTWLPVSLGAIDPRWLFACVLLGYVLVDAVEGVSRIWDRRYVVVEDDTIPPLDEACVDASHMEEQPIVSMGNLRDPSFADRAWALTDKERDEQKRQWMLGALFVALCLVIITDGLLLVVLENSVLNEVLVLCFYLHGFTLSMALLGGMLHAKFHLTAGGRWPRWIWWWLLVGVAWSFFVLILGVGLPLWLQTPAASILTLLAHPLFMVLYGLAAGVLLKLHVYYYSRRLDPNTTRADVAWGLLVFWCSAGQACLTGFWI